MIILTKREEYLKAWKEMWEKEKEAYKKDWRMKKVNPFRFLPLQTEVDNYCAIAYEKEPVGLFGVVRTPTRLLAKQIVVSPSHQRKGIGTKLILFMEDVLRKEREKGVFNMTHYFITCLDSTAGIYLKRGIEPISPAKKEYNGILYEIRFKVCLTNTY